MGWTVYNSDGQILQGSSTLANDAVDSQHYSDGSIDLVHMSSQSVDEDNLYISNSGSNGNVLTKQSGNSGGLTWASGATTAHGISDHTDVARTLFIPVMGAHIVDSFTVVDASRYHGLRAADNVYCSATFTSRVPSDFASFTSIKMLWQSPASSGNLVFKVYMHWAGAGEVDNIHAESGDTQTVATAGVEYLNYTPLTSNSNTAWAFNGLAVGDIFGAEFRCMRNNGSDTLSNTVDVMGFEFNYVAVQ